MDGLLLFVKDVTNGGVDFMIRNKKEKCVMCGEPAVIKSSEIGELLCEECYKINKQIKDSKD